MKYGTIRRGEMAEDNYTTLANAIFRSAELSGNAVKVFGLLASHKNGYGVTVPQIVKHMKCSTDAVNSALKELEGFELLVRTRERRPDGTLGKATDYHITDAKFLAREEGQNPRSEPKRENPILAPTWDDADEPPPNEEDFPEESPEPGESPGQNLNGKTPIQVNPGTKKTNNNKKNKDHSVRPERNAGASDDGAAADGRTDGPSPSSDEHEPAPTDSVEVPAEVTASEPAEGSAASLLADPVVAAHLARIDMRPEQRRRLETAMDAALREFSAGRVTRYLHEKAGDAGTAMYLVRAFEEFAHAIVLVGQPPMAPADRAAEPLDSDRSSRGPREDCHECHGDGWVLGPDGDPVEPARRCTCAAVPV